MAASRECVYVWAYGSAKSDAQKSRKRDEKVCTYVFVLASILTTLIPLQMFHVDDSSAETAAKFKKHKTETNDAVRQDIAIQLHFIIF